MSRILGLDLGSSSIGHAVIESNDNVLVIKSLGSRIIYALDNDLKEFNSGQTISKNAKRTQRRTIRKGYFRYQLRRKNLSLFLAQHNMTPQADERNLSKLALWELRAKAAIQQITRSQLGRILLHINQKRGYSSMRIDGDDKSSKEYVKDLFVRYTKIKEANLTIGQHLYAGLCDNPAYRVKDQVFPRIAYEDEFDTIIAKQTEFYPETLTPENIDRLRNQIIFYQRKLKSCKHLVSICDFMKRSYTTAEGKIVEKGPKVAPSSSPLAQVCKIWESVNNIELKNRRGESLEITPQQRKAMFEYLDGHETLKLTALYKLLGIDKKDGWWGSKSIGKGIQGNKTKLAIAKALDGKYNHLLNFDLKLSYSNRIDEETGEVLQEVDKCFEKENLYILWHLIYSIEEEMELKTALKKNFNIDDTEVLTALVNLDFVKSGYANKSAKAMRHILPHLALGLKYSEACEMAGFRHSNSLTLEEIANKPLLDKLKPIQKNELRQPVVEKILNQMINLVNELMAEYGHFDEIRVELARELKMSIEERNKTSKAMNNAEKINKNIALRIAEYGLTPTRSRIQKYKLWEESNQKCFYCNQPVNVVEFLRGYEIEVEHIIPKSLYFDDSFSNKVCACRHCNREKNNRTAYDYMQYLGQEQFENYQSRTKELYDSKKISKTKYNNLLTTQENIPTDFISRQLRESQYIAKKAREILSTVSRNVTATSGSVTAYLRHVWGWDTILQSLNIERYRLIGLVEIVEREHKNKKWTEEVIKGWSKRDDHRHHAIDALTIACTKQGYIQRMSTMNSQNSEDEKNEQKTNLKRYFAALQPFTTAKVEEAVSKILVSYKAGKKAATLGKRYSYRGGRKICKQTGIIIPRGALHEESIYGYINRYTKKKDGSTTQTPYSVFKYPLSTITKKNIIDIVDKSIQRLVQERFDQFVGDEKKIWQDLGNHPLLFNGTPIRSVRCFTGLKSESMAHTNRGYVKLGNNHHIAIYKDEKGDTVEHCVTFWHAVDRMRYHIPAIIKHPAEAYDALNTDTPNEFVEQLPHPRWSYLFSFQQNDMFILGMEPEAFEEAYRMQDYALLGQHLYKVQNISSLYYNFCLHTVTQFTPSGCNKPDKRFIRIQSIKALLSCHPQKVQINNLGKITKL